MFEWDPKCDEQVKNKWENLENVISVSVPRKANYKIKWYLKTLASIIKCIKRAEGDRLHVIQSKVVKICVK